MKMQKLKKLLTQQFGKIPDTHYFYGDLNYIRAYYDYRRDNGLDDFLIDDITWYDLDMDRVFKRINPGRSMSGEQYLYYMLRSPSQDKDTYESRQGLIQFMQEDPSLRLNIEVILARLGCKRRADICAAFSPVSHGRGLLVVYSLLFLAFLVAVIMIPILHEAAAKFVITMFLINSLLHERMQRKIERDLDTVNYTVSMIFAMRQLHKLRSGLLDKHMAAAYESLKRLRAVIHTGGVTMANTGTFWDLIATVTLLDLITYEFLKRKLGKCHEDVFIIHEYLGRLDAAIAIASYRQSVPYYVEPEIWFDEKRNVTVHAEDMIHPLLEDAIPNDWITERPMLITGSNASGKSTYLKTAALTAILSQSICTSLASSYSASAFRIYSSMALSDDLLAGESYYIVETKSLKRIVDSTNSGGTVLCVIDEVLRGTNTIERIAASSEVLKVLAENGALCLAATHDIELCGLLEKQYAMYHFEEEIGQTEMTFDYTLRFGKTTSRNAINLLRLIGFDDEIVDNAHNKATCYLNSGTWSQTH